MARLYLFAEGPTEQTFADIILKPHLSQFKVFLSNSILVANSRRKKSPSGSQKYHRGGGDRYYHQMKADIVGFLKQDQSPDAFFTTMVDLYGIPENFPKLDEAERFRSNPIQRVEFLERCFAEDVSGSLPESINASRFIPYLQLHEYEAYLFSDPSCFSQLGDAYQAQIQELQSIADAFEHPELINDGASTAPSKRILQRFPNYQKVIDGVLLVEAIGLGTIREKCPHFNAWLSCLESLGEA